MWSEGGCGVRGGCGVKEGAYDATQSSQKSSGVHTATVCCVVFIAQWLHHPASSLHVCSMSEHRGGVIELVY